MKSQTSFVVLLLLLIPFSMMAQDALVQGKVTDGSNGEPLLSTNILIQGTTTGTSADLEGRYTLRLAPGDHTLIYSFLGMETYKQKISIKAGETQTIDVVMQVKAQELHVFVVTGSKYKKKLSEEIVSMEVLQPMRFQETNLTLDEALNKVPGFNLLGESASIRGGSGYAAGSASRVMVMLDGVPLMSPDNGVIYWEALPLENIEQVEIIKGASSALYGSAALNGIVNIRTANPRNEPYTKVIMNMGFYQHPKDRAFSSWWNGRTRSFGEGSFIHMRKFNRFDISFGGNYKQDRSYLNFNERKRARTNIKFRYKPVKFEKVTLGINSNWLHESGGAFFLWAGIDSSSYQPRTITTDATRSINIDPYATIYDKKDNRHGIRSRYYNSWHEDTDGAFSNTNQYLAEYSFTKTWLERDMNLISGVTGYRTKTVSATFGDHKAGNFAAFAQFDKKFFDRWTISAGIRLEYFRVDTLRTKNEIKFFNKLFNRPDTNLITAPVKPVVRIGTNVQITERTFARASFGQGYRFPTIAELFVRTQRSGVETYPNPGLAPETGWSAEIGIKQGVSFSDWLAYFDLALFITKYRDMMEFTFGRWGTAMDPLGGNGFRANNVGNARIRGIEISSFGQGQLGDIPFDFLVGYTYIDPVNLDYDPDEPMTSDNNPLLKYRVKHTAKANVSVGYKGLKLGMNGTYQSYMENVDDFISLIPGVTEFREENNTGDIVIDTQLGYKFKGGTQVNFLAKNLFNRTYALRPGFLEPPRNYTFQVQYEF